MLVPITWIYNDCLQDDLLNELIRLQQSKVVDPKEVLLVESCDSLVQSTLLPGPESSSLSRSVRGKN